MGLAIGIGNGILFTSQSSKKEVAPDFITTWKKDGTAQHVFKLALIDQ